MQYDGVGKLGEAIAALYGCSPRNNNKIAELIQQAKDGLGMTSQSKRLPDDVKRALYRWHYERLNSVQDVKQDDPVQDDDVQSLDETLVQNVKQSEGDKLACYRTTLFIMLNRMCRFRLMIETVLLMTLNRFILP